MVSPSWRRKAVHHLVRRFHVSVRRACRLLGQHRSTQTYEAVPADYQVELVKRMNALAAEHPKYGYRMVANLLQGEGWKVNIKRVARLWVLERNQVRPKRKAHTTTRARGASSNAAWRLRSKHPHHIWGMDFMSGKTRRGGAIRILNIVCEFTREALGCRVDVHIGTAEVIAELEEAFAKYGKPKIIRVDNGREFIAASLKDWLTARGVILVHIEKGQPQQNCFVERYNGTMRSEVLDVEDFDTVLEARVVLREWAFVTYNTQRPHRGHAMMTPRQFADHWKVGRR